MTIAWAQMLFTKDAGGSVHHVILLWPLPAFLVALALSRIPWRFVIAITAILAGSGALVINEYYAQLVRNGPQLIWTDALYPLSDCLNRVKPRAIYINDWGIFDNLRMLNRGHLPLRVGSDDKSDFLKRIGEPDTVFVGHPDGQQLFQGVNEKLRSYAQEAGYRRELIEEIRDRNGRAAFEVIRFVPTR